MEKILCAAIWYKDRKVHTHQPKNIPDGYVWCGRRHNNIITLRSELLGEPTRRETSVQGFITSEDRFVDRIEAGQIAQNAGQIKECVMVGLAGKSGYIKPETEELISEELY